MYGEIITDTDPLARVNVMSYPAGEGPDWGWRLRVCLRTMGPERLVLQMTNVTPWGEEARAVRMTCERD